MVRMPLGEARLISPGGSFFSQDILLALLAGASEHEREIAETLLAGAEERAARANHGAKDTCSENCALLTT